MTFSLLHGLLIKLSHFVVSILKIGNIGVAQLLLMWWQSLQIVMQLALNLKDLLLKLLDEGKLAGELAKV